MWPPRMSALRRSVFETGLDLFVPVLSLDRRESELVLLRSLWVSRASRKRLPSESREVLSSRSALRVAQERYGTLGRLT